MPLYSDDSSESENKFHHKKSQLSPTKRKDSEDSPKTHGIVDGSKSPSKKSPPKQSQTNNPDSPEKQTQTYHSRKGYSSSNDERVAKRSTQNVNVERFSSGDESDRAGSRDRIAAQARKNLFNNDDETCISRDRNRSINAYDANENEDSSSQDVRINPKKQNRIFIKQEVISEDEEPAIRKDFEIFSQPEKCKEFTSSKEEAESSGSDSEIPPSQFWLTMYKEDQKKSSPKKNSSPKDKAAEEEGRTSESDESTDRKVSQRKSPPRITKTEIVNTKYERNDRQVSQNEDERLSDIANDEKGDREGSDNNESNENILSKRGSSQESKSSIEGTLGTGGDVSKKEFSPVKTPQSQKKTSLKQKLDVNSKRLHRRSGIKAEPNTNKKPQEQKLNNKMKDGPFKVRANICDSDTTSEEEEERVKTEQTPKNYVLCLKKPKDLSKNPRNSNGKQMLLALKHKKQILENNETNFPSKDKSSPREASIPRRNDVNDNSSEDSFGNAAPSPTIKKKVSPKKMSHDSSDSDEEKPSLTKASTSREQKTIKQRRPTESTPASLKRKVASEDSSSDKEASLKRKVASEDSSSDKEASSKRKVASEDRSSDKEASSKRKVASEDSSSDKEASLKRKVASEDSSSDKEASSKRKIDSEESSSDKEASPTRNIAQVPLRRKHPDTDSSETKFKKRVKLTPSSEQPAALTSDSDDTDSLTKLNTTLNKSMAFMDSQVEPETFKLNKSRKSVSINTKQNLTHPANDSRNQKSILKKPEQVATNDNNEDDSQTQEQDVEKNIESTNVPPKTIKRPLNLRKLKDQENLANDSTKASFGLDDISDDDEIYILDVPRTIDPKELRGQTIRLGSKNKLQIGDQLYETCSRDAINISCVFRTDREQNSYKAVNVKPTRWINVRQRLPKTLHVELCPVEKRTVPFPENLKLRHPLLGAEYKDKIIIADNVGSKKTSLSTKKRIDSIKIEKREMKSKNVEKHKNKKVKLSQEFNKSENNSGDKMKKSRQFQSNNTSSDSDSDASFFQKVKQESMGKNRKRENPKHSSTILNLDDTSSTTDLPIDSEDSVIAIKRKGLSANKKLGLSLNSFAMRNTSFDVNSEDNEFFSSTPIKIEKGTGETLTSKIRKRKSCSDIARVTASPKKLKAN